MAAAAVVPSPVTPLVVARDRTTRPRCRVRFGPSQYDLTQRPSIVSMPDRMSSNRRRGILRSRSVRTSLSSAVTRETFATESCGRPVSSRRSNTLPGALAHLRLLVRGTQTTVAILLRLIALHCATTTGRRYPGSEPVGSWRSAHQTSACSITTRLAAEPVAPHAD